MILHSADTGGRKVNALEIEHRGAQVSAAARATRPPARSRYNGDAR
jgi:hypothetical protein